MLGSMRPGCPRRHRRAGAGPTRLPLRTPAAAEPPGPLTRRPPRAVDLQLHGEAVVRPWSRVWATGLGEPQLGVGLLKRLDHRVQVAIQNLIKVVGLESDSVIGDAILWKVVGTNALGTVDGSNLTTAGRGGSAGSFFFSGCRQPRPEHPHRLFAVLQLRALVLAGDNNAARQMGDSHSRVGGVDALTPRAGRAIDIDPEVPLVDSNLGLGNLRHDKHTSSRGMQPTLGLRHRHPLYPMHTALELEDPVRHRVGFSLDRRLDRYGH